VTVRTRCALLALALSMLVCAPASGFSDPALFTAAATMGGGDGRFFTGSPADGHSCGVCHSGDVAPGVVFEGLPDFTEPFARYDVTVRWAQPEMSHALQLELMSLTGQHPGVELSNADALPPEARCEGEPDGPSAVAAVDVGTRRVLGVQDCGARALTFSFVASEEPLYFAVGVVRSDRSATPEGDGVLEHRSVLEPLHPSSAGSCSFGASSCAGAGWAFALGALFLQLAFRRLSPRVQRKRFE
jgi:hypothetical protein